MLKCMYVVEGVFGVSGEIRMWIRKDDSGAILATDIPERAMRFSSLQEAETVAGLENGSGVWSMRWHVYSEHASLEVE